MGSRPTPDSFAALPINEESIGNTRKSARSSVEIGCNQFRILKTLEQPAFLRHRRRDCSTFVSCPAFSFHSPSKPAAAWNYPASGK